MGEIGKIALALMLGEKIESRFKDGQIFLTLEGMSQNPLSALMPWPKLSVPFAALENVYLKIKNELQGLYDSVLADKKVLSCWITLPTASKLNHSWLKKCIASIGHFLPG